MSKPITKPNPEYEVGFSFQGRGTLLPKVFEKHIIPPSARIIDLDDYMSVALDISKARLETDHTIVTTTTRFVNTIFEYNSDWWILEVGEKSHEFLLRGNVCVIRSSRPLISFQCEFDASTQEWTTQYLGLRYAYFSTSEDNHFLKRSLELCNDKVNVSMF